MRRANEEEEKEEFARATNPLKSNKSAGSLHFVQSGSLINLKMIHHVYIYNLYVFALEM
jgi:hypothetical protein